MARKHFKLEARSVEELERRITTLRQALRMRYGRVVRIKRARRPTTDIPAATIYYTLPLVAARNERFVAH